MAVQQEIFRFTEYYSGREEHIRILWKEEGGVDIYTVEEYVIRGKTWKTVSSALPAESPSASPPYANIIVAGLTSDTKFCSGKTLTSFQSIATFPYAQKITTPDSPECNQDGSFVLWGVPVVQVVDESIPAASDGKITVSIPSYYPIDTFTLTLQVEGGFIGEKDNGIFENLAPQTYQVAVRDSESNFYFIQNIVVKPGTFDAYGDFIIAPFHDINTRSLLLSIKKKGWEGVTRQVNLSSAPVTYSYKGTQTDWLFSTIYGLSLDFELQADELRDLSVLYTNDDREYLVELTRDGILLFRGYLLPEFIRQEYVNYKNFPIFTTTDGLGQLKTYKFLDGDGKRLTGKMNLQTIIEICIKKVSLGFQVYNGIKWRYVKNDDPLTTSDNLFEKLYIDVSVFYRLNDSDDITCDVVVSEILKTFMARLFQHEGNFLIETPYNYLDTDTSTFTGKTGNIVLDRIMIAGNVAELTYGTVPMIVISPETSIEIEPGSQIIRTIANLQPTDGLLPYPSFGKNAYNSNNVLKSWTGSLVYAKVVDGTRTDWGGVQTDPWDNLTVVDARTKETDVKFLSHFPVRLQWTETLSVALIMRFTAKKLNGRSQFKLYIKWGSYFLDTNGTKWVYAAPLQNRPESFLNYIFTEELYDNEQQIEIQTPLLPDTGNTFDYLEIGFTELWTLDAAAAGQVSDSGFSPGRVQRLSPLKNVFKISYVNVLPLINGAELVKESIRTYQNPLKFTTQSKEIELSIGQRADDPRNADVFFPYGFFDVSGFAITQWVPEDELEEAVPEKFNITEMVQRTMIKVRKINREALDAGIKGDVVFFSKILMSKDNNLIYFISDLSGEFRTNTHKARLLYSEGSFVLDRFKQDEETGEAKTDEETDKPKREENYLYDEDFGG